ncbi:hypothetical protein [Streptomyces pluripotens]|uniref:hypothetical protein n=1 Tax=Streptomyces pluripotens TaxID=1355015 RepID=UPI001F475011|nr:hypothetical protein [Streptomyces pluripotens]
MSPDLLRHVRKHRMEHGPAEPPQLQDPEDGNEGSGGRGKRLAIALVVVLAVGGAGVGLIAGSGDDRQTGAVSNGASRNATVAVVRTDLSDALSLQGSLGFGRAVTVKGGKEGVVTQLPGVGATVSRGESLYRLDDRPVPVFYGSTPLFRTLDTKGVAGRDVKVIADNLQALGYAVGTQPAPGSWIDEPVQQTDPAHSGSAQPSSAQSGSAQQSGSVRQASAQTGPSHQPSAPAGPSGAAGTGAPASSAPATVHTQLKKGEAVLTDSLISAVKKWQTHVGMSPTGVLGPGDVYVTSGAVRVGAVQAQPGDPATGTLLSVTNTVKLVTVPVDPTQVGSINSGDKVTVVLPDNSTTPGTVSAISTTVQSGDAGSGGNASGTSRVNVTVTLSNANAVSRLNSATVQVQFSTHTRKGVLAVPVGALLALSGGGYAVQLPDGHLVAVKTGLFAKGQVEITGEGIGPGTKVVTTS